MGAWLGDDGAWAGAAKSPCHLVSAPAGVGGGICSTWVASPAPHYTLKDASKGRRATINEGNQSWEQCIARFIVYSYDTPQFSLAMERRGTT